MMVEVNPNTTVVIINIKGLNSPVNDKDQNDFSKNQLCVFYRRRT